MFVQIGLDLNLHKTFVFDYFSYNRRLFRFLFHKGTVAYRQYQQLVEQYKMEMEKAEQENYKPEDIYEPEMANDDDHTIIKMDNDNGNNRKRRRKSRWGDKDITVPPPSLINAVPTGPGDD